MKQIKSGIRELLLKALAGFYGLLSGLCFISTEIKKIVNYYISKKEVLCRSKIRPDLHEQISKRIFVLRYFNINLLYNVFSMKLCGTPFKAFD